MFEFVNKYVISPCVPIVLILSGFYYLIVLSAKPLKNPFSMIKVMITKEKVEKSSQRGISPFRSVTMALAGTLGVGNIVGVATAISCGGFGAVFWMWISALFSMILKYAEIVLSIAYRPINAHGENKGGAMYYIKACFSKMKMKRTGEIVALIFASLCILDSLSMGCILQVNSVSCAFSSAFNTPNHVCSIILTILCALVVAKGARKISKLTEILVPLMSFGYIVISVAVMIICRDKILWAFSQIIKSAFDFKSMTGGIFGFIMSDALRFGAMRGLLSNEAGCGTAPFAHSASIVNEPAKQGVWGIFEVFVDTILLCTMTAIVIILNFDKVWEYQNDGIMMTMKAYGASLGKFSEYFLAIAIFLFAYATVICWAHYGFECSNYIFKNNKFMRKIYFCVLCYCIYIGGLMAPNEVWILSDFSIGTMTIINLFAICMLSREVKLYTDRVFK